MPQYRDIPPLTYEEWDLLFLAIGAGVGLISLELPHLLRDLILVINKVGSRSPDFAPYDPDNFPERMTKQ